MLFFERRENVEKKLDRYFELCDECYARADTAFTIFFAKEPRDKFEAAVEKTHLAESSADDLRREIEHLLYGRALLPESRGDLLGLLETFDRLPNIVETVLFALLCQRTEIPDELMPLYKKLWTINLDAYRLTRKCVDALLGNPRATLHTTKEVDQKESESDRLERELICQIFEMDVDSGTKVLLKEIALLIGEISDRAERAADRMGIVAIKRQI